MTTWDPTRYGQFSDERARPFFDLMARVAAQEPRLVVDLGCGNGPLTLSLAERWPQARVVGVDSSAEMLDAARALDTDGRVYYRRKRAEGKKPMEALRCLKRKISDSIYRQLLADAQRATGADPALRADASDQPLPGPAKPRLQPETKSGKSEQEKALIKAC